MKNINSDEMILLQVHCWRKNWCLNIWAEEYMASWKECSIIDLDQH